MTHITEIPIKELEQDLKESLEDIENCKLALKLGIEKLPKSEQDVKERLEVNEKIAEKIRAELKRREEHKEVFRVFGNKLPLGAEVDGEVIKFEVIKDDGKEVGIFYTRRTEAMVPRLKNLREAIRNCKGIPIPFNIIKNSIIPLKEWLDKEEKED